MQQESAGGRRQTPASQGLSAPAVCSWSAFANRASPSVENEGFGADRAEIPAKRLWEHPLLLIGAGAIISMLFNLAETRQKN